MLLCTGHLRAYSTASFLVEGEQGVNFSMLSMISKELFPVLRSQEYFLAQFSD